MNKEVSLRQIAYTFLFISLAQLLRQLPTALAQTAGRSGYLSPLWSVIVMVPITAIIIVLIKAFPGMNFYEIMVQLIGKLLAKLFILFYFLWILLGITTKINAYSMTLQFTLMPQTRSDFFMVILIVLVYYALMRGMKAVFRFSEFTLGTILVFFIVLFICAFSKLRLEYLLPISTTYLPETLWASKHVLAIGGNIILALFFADKFGIMVTKFQIRKLWYAILVFTVLSFLLTVFTYGVTGASLTSILPFPFYITVKSISFFNLMERFEVLVTVICVLSDFISICIFAIILIRSFEWLFGLKPNNYIFVPMTVIVFYLTYYISSTQFESNYLYKNVIENLNLVFELMVPLFLGFIYLLKRNKIKNQY